MQRTHDLIPIVQDKPQCHLASCLMCMSCFGIQLPIKKAASLIGHDGCTIRGYHDNEILDFLALFRLGFIVYDSIPICVTLKGNATNVFTDHQAEQRFKSLIKRNVGMLITETHAIAWDGDSAYDPNHYSIVNVDNYNILQFQRIVTL